MIRTLKAVAVLGTAYIALIACPSGTKGVFVPSPSATASVAASPTESATPLPSATESASPSASATESAAASATEAPTTAPTAAATTAPTTEPTQAPTQAPTTAPTTAPTVAPTPAPTTPAPTVAANPWAGYLFAPNASGPVPAGFTRYGATVVDAYSGAPVVGACVYTGPPSGCPTKGVNKTDANGFFAVDLPSGSAFAFNIQSDPQNAIYAALIQITVPGGTNTTLKMTHK